MLYRAVCEWRSRWDEVLPEEHWMENWQTWERNLPDKVDVPRSIVQDQEFHFIISSVGVFG